MAHQKPCVLGLHLPPRNDIHSIGYHLVGANLQDTAQTRGSDQSPGGAKPDPVALRKHHRAFKAPSFTFVHNGIAVFESRRHRFIDKNVLTGPYRL